MRKIILASSSRHRKKLLDQLKISDFVKGIVNHVEIQEVKKNSPSMQDVFLNVVKNG